MKRISQLDTDLDKAQEQLSEANTKLEEAHKKSADVSVHPHFILYLFFFSIRIEKQKRKEINIFFKTKMAIIFSCPTKINDQSSISSSYISL